MEAKGTTFNRPSHDEVKEMFRRAKARQQQLEEEGRRMWEEDFFAKIKRAEKQPGKSFESIEELDKYIRNL